MSLPASRAGRVTRQAHDTTQAARGGAVSLQHPFKLGFFLAVGAFLAWWLGGVVLSVGSTLILIVVAGFLAAGLNPVVEWLGRLGLAPVITDQVSTIVKNAPGWFDELAHNGTIRRLDRQYDLLDKAQKALSGGNVGSALFGGVVGVGLKLLSFVANTFIVVVLTLYLLATLPKVKRSAYRFAPASRRERVAELGDRIIDNVGSYVSGAFVVATAGWYGRRGGGPAGPAGWRPRVAPERSR